MDTQGNGRGEWCPAARRRCALGSSCAVAKLDGGCLRLDALHVWNIRRLISGEKRVPSMCRTGAYWQAPYIPLVGLSVWHVQIQELSGALGTACVRSTSNDTLSLVFPIHKGRKI